MRMKGAAFLATLLLSCLVATMADPKQKQDQKHTQLGPRQSKRKPVPGDGHPVVGGRGPIVEGPITGERQDVTGSNDAHLAEVSNFALDHLTSSNSELHFVQYKAEAQVVAGLMYTLYYRGNNDEGVCQEEHMIVVYDKPWVNERVLKSDIKSECT